MSRRFAGRHRAQLGDLSMAAGISDGSRLAVERSGRSALDRACKIRQRSRLEDRHRNASWIWVYSPETMLKLRSIVGSVVGCNFDPSHLFWQGIDPIAAVRVLEGAIFHVHAKDTQLYPVNLQR